MFDYNRSLDDDDKELIESAGEVPCIAIINKTDLDKQLDTEYIESKIKMWFIFRQKAEMAEQSL